MVVSKGGQGIVTLAEHNRIERVFGLLMGRLMPVKALISQRAVDGRVALLTSKTRQCDKAS